MFNCLYIFLENTMKKKIQNIIFLIIGFIFMSIAIFPIVYFHVIFFDKTNSFAYYLFKGEPYYNLILFTFIFFLLSFFFIVPGISLFQHEKEEKPFSFKRSFYILVFVSLIEFFIMNLLFPGVIITMPPPN
ncbi:MAG: hypothetical protein CEE42_04480 [Promethearchaeota archaeon Loki_b31]|nr:MAG: hypothetical protein CEE42_04480 [Candidatus Lokiarchaeota archaeon Loki_b31]